MAPSTRISARRKSFRKPQLLMDRAFRQVVLGATGRRKRGGERTLTGTSALGIGTTQATAAPWLHWRRRWLAQSLKSKPLLREGVKKFSLHTAEIGRK